MLARVYQKKITTLLEEIFGSDLVIREWSVGKGATDAFLHAGTYAPRLDIAVGPFNINRDVGQNLAAIHAKTKHPLVGELKRQIGILNGNPRCLLAIEIEFSGSSKHILGDFTNASMMGLIGIVVGSSHNIEKICRVGEYAALLYSLGKAPSLFKNVKVFQDSKFLEFITAFRL